MSSSTQVSESGRTVADDASLAGETPVVVGWREWVGVPELCGHAIKAKIDTGAKTSALHAFDLEVYARKKKTWARFEVHPIQRNNDDARIVEARIVEFRPVQSSNGASEIRPVILTPISIGGMTYEAEITLTNRDQMGFRMLLGRSALQGRVLVDPALSYCLGDPDERPSN